MTRVQLHVKKFVSCQGKASNPLVNLEKERRGREGGEGSQTREEQEYRATALAEGFRTVVPEPNRETVANGVSRR